MAKMFSKGLPLPRLVFQGLVLVGITVKAFADLNETGSKHAAACFGNYNNFLDVSCPPNYLVNILTMWNGAKPSSRHCPPVITDRVSFPRGCCSFSEGDCVIKTHPNTFPAECTNVAFCKPRSTRASTQPNCNSDEYPEYTHYTEITYSCVKAPPQTEPPTSTISTQPASTSSATSATYIRTTTTTSIPTSTSPLPVKNSTTPMHTVHSTRTISASDGGDNMTPAMIGGMVAGIVGLLLTVFIFIFYWGRKRRIRMERKNQNNVWDFLLSNTMSVRSFRGYDNFSSSGRQSLSSEDGSPLTRKTVWLPNITLNTSNVSRDSIVTLEDNNSVPTVERGTSGASVSNGICLGVTGQTAPGGTTINRL